MCVSIDPFNVCKHRKPRLGACAAWGQKNGAANRPAYCVKALSLTPQDREQYHSKLVLANGDCLPDPELLTEWVDKVSNWPDIHLPAIYCYLVDKLSVYTREN